MNKKNKTTQKVKTKGKKSPAIYAENGNVSITYGNSGNGEQSNPKEQSPKKSKWLRYLGLLALICGILGGIAECSGYTLRDFSPNGEAINKPNHESLPAQQLETKGDNSPAVIVNDGDATFNYDESIQKKDSTSQK